MDARGLTTLNAHPLAILGVRAVMIVCVELVSCWWLNIFGGS